MFRPPVHRAPRAAGGPDTDRTGEFVLFVSILQRLGFRSEAGASEKRPASLQSRAAARDTHAGSKPARARTPRLNEQTPVQGITAESSVSRERSAARKLPAGESRSHREPAMSGTQRRPAVKALATRKATSGKPASAASRSGAAAGRVSPVAKAPNPRHLPRWPPSRSRQPSLPPRPAARSAPRSLPSPSPRRR